MTIAVANLTTANTFGHLLNTVDVLASLMTANVLTIGGTVATGNAALVGTWTANTCAMDVITTAGSGNTVVSGTVLVIDTSASIVANGNTTLNGLFTANTLTLTGAADLTNTLFTNTNTGYVGIGPGMTAPTQMLFVNGAISATGDVQGFQTSDITLKENVKLLDLSFAADVIAQLNPISFDWKADAASRFVAPASPHEYGFIAQQLQELVPELVEERPDGTLAINKLGLIPFLWRVLQDQQITLNALLAQVERLEKQVDGNSR